MKEMELHLEVDASLAVTTPSSSRASSSTERSRGHSREVSPGLGRESWDSNSPGLPSASPRASSVGSSTRAGSAGGSDWPSSQVCQRTC